MASASSSSAAAAGAREPREGEGGWRCELLHRSRVRARGPPGLSRPPSSPPTEAVEARRARRQPRPPWDRRAPPRHPAVRAPPPRVLAAVPCARRGREFELEPRQPWMEIEERGRGEEDAALPAPWPPPARGAVAARRPAWTRVTMGGHELHGLARLHRAEQPCLTAQARPGPSNPAAGGRGRDGCPHRGARAAPSPPQGPPPGAPAPPWPPMLTRRPPRPTLFLSPRTACRDDDTGTRRTGCGRRWRAEVVAQGGGGGGVPGEGGSAGRQARGREGRWGGW